MNGGIRLSVRCSLLLGPFAHLTDFFIAVGIGECDAGPTGSQPRHQHRRRIARNWPYEGNLVAFVHYLADRFLAGHLQWDRSADGEVERFADRRLFLS